MNHIILHFGVTLATLGATKGIAEGEQHGHRQPDQRASPAVGAFAGGACRAPLCKSRHGQPLGDKQDAAGCPEHAFARESLWHHDRRAGEGRRGRDARDGGEGRATDEDVCGGTDRGGDCRGRGARHHGGGGSRVSGAGVAAAASGAGAGIFPRGRCGAAGRERPGGEKRGRATRCRDGRTGRDGARKWHGPRDALGAAGVRWAYRRYRRAGGGQHPARLAGVYRVGGYGGCRCCAHGFVCTGALCPPGVDGGHLAPAVGCGRHGYRRRDGRFRLAAGLVSRRGRCGYPAHTLACRSQAPRGNSITVQIRDELSFALLAMALRVLIKRCLTPIYHLAQAASQPISSIH